jgi:hypothetical protein
LTRCLSSRTLGSATSQPRKIAEHRVWKALLSAARLLFPLQEVAVKNRLFSVRGYAVGICLVSVLAVTGSDERATAQMKQGKYVTQASARLAKLIDAGNTDGYSLHNNSFSLGGGWLKKNQDAWVPIYSVNLTAGKKYRFLASGDDDAKDVDLRVIDPKGNQVAIDEGTAVDAVVDFTPKVSGKYKVEIRLYDSKGDDDCVCISAMMVMKTK